MKIFTGDLEPALKVVLSDSATGIDLATATQVRVIGKRAGAIVFDRSGADIAIQTTGETSTVTMPWKTGDTDERGSIKIEVEIVWPGDRPQTIRPTDQVDIENDFDKTA